jgi:uncharacterized membrane protein YtjA (UPF0391 family)
MTESNGPDMNRQRLQSNGDALTSLLFQFWISTKDPKTMLQLAITCLVIALIAAVLGFGGIAGSFMGVAKILFVVFLVLAVVSFLLGRRRIA